MKKIILIFILISSTVFAAPDPTPVEPTLTNVGASTQSVTDRNSSENITDCGTLSTANTKYVLQNNVASDGSCFTITASGNVTLDLNGKTVTYGNADSSSAIAGIIINSGGATRSNFEVVNGTIAEGTGTHTPPSNTGNTCNPILDGGSTNVVLKGLTITYKADEQSGIYALYTNQLSVHDCTITDNGTVIVNRTTSKAAIKNTSSASGVGSYYNNLIINYRHCGIQMAKASSAYNNDLQGLSVHTNSTGIGPYWVDDPGCDGIAKSSIYGNKIVSRGVHPIGLWVGCNQDIYNNYVDVESTVDGVEYDGSMGIRGTWGSRQGNIFNNTFISTTNGGRVARGVMLGGYHNDKTIYFTNNLIIVTSDDGTTKAVGVSSEANGEDTPNDYNGLKLYFCNNTIKCNLYPILIGGSYGPSKNYPVFSDNRIIKFGSYAGYKTIYDENYDVTSTMRLCLNTYEGGAAADDITLRAAPTYTKEVLISEASCSYLGIITITGAGAHSISIGAGTGSLTISP